MTFIDCEFSAVNLKRSESEFKRYALLNTTQAKDTNLSIASFRLG